MTITLLGYIGLAILTWLIIWFIMLVYSITGILLFIKIFGEYFVEYFVDIDHIDGIKSMIKAWPKYYLSAKKQIRWNRRNLLCLPPPLEIEEVKLLE